MGALAVYISLMEIQLCLCSVEQRCVTSSFSSRDWSSPLWLTVRNICSALDSCWMIHRRQIVFVFFVRISLAPGMNRSEGLSSRLRPTLRCVFTCKMCVFRSGEEPGCVRLTRRPTGTPTWRTRRSSKSSFRINTRRKNGEKCAPLLPRCCETKSGAQGLMELLPV